MEINLTRIALGLVFSFAIGALAYWRRSLTLSGWAGAVLTGTLTLGSGGWAWGLTLVTFFVSSSLLSHYKEQAKAQRAREKFAKGGQRDLLQTLANGGIGSVLALAYGTGGQQPFLLAAFVGVMATVTADTWATELGVLSPHQPRMITSGKRVAAGTSGGITPLGTAASAAGGLTIGVVMLVLLSIERPAGIAAVPWWTVFAGLLGGVAGSLFDSLLGATVQAMYRYPYGSETERPRGRDGTPNTFLRGWRWLDNDMVNMLSSLVGGLVAVGVLLLSRGLFHA